MTGAKKIVGLLLGLCLITLTGAILAYSKTPVIARLNGRVKFENQRAFDILNPFRNRGPERPAEAILRDVQQGRCNDVIRRFGLANPDPKCQRDTELRIISWKLQARDHYDEKETMLLYKVKRDFGDHGLDNDPYWFQVQRQPDGEWKVIALDRWF